MCYAPDPRGIDRVLISPLRGHSVCLWVSTTSAMLSSVTHDLLLASQPHGIIGVWSVLNCTAYRQRHMFTNDLPNDSGQIVHTHEWLQLTVSSIICTKSTHEVEQKLAA